MHGLLKAVFLTNKVIMVRDVGSICNLRGGQDVSKGTFHRQRYLS